MKNNPLTEEEKKAVLSIGWRFAGDDYIYLPDDWDGCMAYGYDNIRRVLKGWKGSISDG
jgi:hypothetical protein